MKRKLGIFVSSTYKDLIEERNVVSKAILASGNIPMGMELFTPTGKTTTEVIKSTIDNCDYLLLIIGGMYGSTLIDCGVEKSYTEMEYDYAVKMCKPVLLFFCEDIGVPTVVDRFVQQAVAQVLTPIFEEQFHDHSYRFRPNRCAQQAVLKALEMPKRARLISQKVSSISDLVFTLTHLPKHTKQTPPRR